MSTLAREIGKKRPFDLPHEEAYLNILRTAGRLEAGFNRLFKPVGLSGAGYNVLRILRGSGGPGRCCQEIGAELVTAVPDITRLVDRLEREGLVRRARVDADRRRIRVQITPAGLQALADLDEPVRALHRRQLGHLSAAELDQINRLLVKARQPQPPPA